MVIVFAAGNISDSGDTTIFAPGTAKNVITVGASENVQLYSSDDHHSMAVWCTTMVRIARTTSRIFPASARAPMVV